MYIEDVNAVNNTFLFLIQMKRKLKYNALSLQYKAHDPLGDNRKQFLETLSGILNLNTFCVCHDAYYLHVEPISSQLFFPNSATSLSRSK